MPAGELDPVDFLDLDALFSDEERMVRDTVRDWVRERVLPEIDGWFERAEFPKEVFPELGKLGLLGMHLHGYGCSGTNAVIAPESAICSSWLEDGALTDHRYVGVDDAPFYALTRRSRPGNRSARYVAPTEGGTHPSGSGHSGSIGRGSRNRSAGLGEALGPVVWSSMRVAAPAFADRPVNWSLLV